MHTRSGRNPAYQDKDPAENRTLAKILRLSTFAQAAIEDPLTNPVRDHLSSYVGQPKIATLKTVGKLQMVHPKQV